MDGYKKIDLYQEALKFELLEDYREAFNLYCNSAKLGYAKAQLAVAKYYLSDGVYKGIIKPDRKKAIEYLNLAGSGGNAEAKYRLAIILLEQKHSGDIKLALELLQDASNRKYSLATYELAKCFYEGIGCQQSYRKALKLLGQIIYAVGDDLAQCERSNEIREILVGIKRISSGDKKTIGFTENDWCLFKDMCNDLDIEDKE